MLEQEDDGPCAISKRVKLSHHADAITWCVANGWVEEDAVAYELCKGQLLLQS